MNWWESAASTQVAVQKYGSPTQAARVMGGISERRAREIWRAMQDAGFVSSLENEQTVGASSTDDGETVTLVSAVNPRGTGALTAEDVLIEAGYDPAEYDYTFQINKSDVLSGSGTMTTLHRISVSARKRPEAMMQFIVPEGWQPPKAPPARKFSQPRLVAVFPDPHAPLYEPTLMDATVAWLEDHADRVSDVLCLGDAADNSPFKRHKKNRRIDCTPEESFWSTYGVLARWRNAAPAAQMELLFGNHETWWYDRLLELFPQGLDFRLPGEELPHNSLAKILKLDELRIKYTETGGEYHDVFTRIAPDLVGMHGTKTGKQGGAVKEQAGWEGTSVVQGHDHKVAMAAVTKRTADGGHVQRYAMSAGTIARHDLGYNPTHDVGQGFMVFTIFDDGRWHPSWALYCPERDDVVWNDWRYAPSAAS